MKCRVCGDINAKCTCICGFCAKCLELNGHKKCREIAEKQEAKKDELLEN